MITIKPKASLIHFPYIGVGQNACDQLRGGPTPMQAKWIKFDLSLMHQYRIFHRLRITLLRSGFCIFS